MRYGCQIAIAALTFLGPALGWGRERVDVRPFVENARARGALLLPLGRLGEIRQRIADDPDARAWWADFRADVASSCVRRTVDVPHGIAQWFHYYSCRTCGTRLEMKSPTMHVCPSCGTTHTGWPYDGSARYDIHNRAAKAARDCALAYRLSNETAFAVAARRRRCRRRSVRMWKRESCVRPLT